MSQNGWTITDIKSKTNIFINHYAGVNKLNMSQGNQNLNRKFKKCINAPSMLHFKWVSYYLPSKRWKVKEQLTPTTFHLHFSSHSVLWPSRNYYPCSTHPFHLLIAHAAGGLPQSFRHCKVASFRPISLTSCVVKPLECILADPLYYFAKTNNLFSQFQVGFRKCQSCKDQITWIVQVIEDGFQQCLIYHSVLTLLAFSKACNTVWREKLLFHMLDTGISSTFICWIQSFFINHRACVQLFNAFSSSCRFTQGLPQGPVLDPLLFLFYINNLASLLNDDAVIALFADDVSILTTARKKEDAKTTVQSAVNSVLIWSMESKLNLNADKNEAPPFSTWSNDNTWQLALIIGTQKIQVNTTPYLLGVILDRSLTFNTHSKKLTMSLSSSLHILRTTAHTSWGWCCSTLKMAFHALICSKLDYAAPAWQPWLSVTNLSCSDCLRNHSLHLIISQLVSSPTEALRLEPDVQSYHTCSNCLILKAREKALHSTDNHPKHVALAADITQCLQNSCSFHGTANNLSTLLPSELQHQQSINHFPSPP